MKIESGQNAIVTGTSRGLGPYIAKALASKGVNVVLAARTLSVLESLSDELTPSGVQILVQPTDMSEQDEIQRLVQRATEELGPIDIVVNNAAIELFADYDQVSVEEIEQMLQVNLLGPMLLSKLCLPSMVERNQGHIVNVASGAGLFPPPCAESYAASKAGLIGFTLSMRASAKVKKSKVSASVICPGFMDDAGMYEEMKKVSGKVKWIVGSMPAHRLGDAVLTAIEKDLPEITLMPGFPKLTKLFNVLAPKMFERSNVRAGVYDALLAVAAHRNEKA
ncbi:MAG: SDR family NAD(P)-dependent oxidoreductase [Deltaproteobacteria bacterium]|nr:SDR family NAD(P)-dependent oxidoreductase [Deltaproteobacteria bacterium]